MPDTAVWVTYRETCCRCLIGRSRGRTLAAPFAYHCCCDAKTCGCGENPNESWLATGVESEVMGVRRTTRVMRRLYWQHRWFEESSMNLWYSKPGYKIRTRDGAEAVFNRLLLGQARSIVADETSEVRVAHN
jgi:hypothetical protein